MPTLKEYIAALIDVLARHEPAGAARLRQVVGRSVARIALDDEAVDVAYVRRRLIIGDAGTSSRQPDGFGRTDRETSAALLDGRLEVHDAILDGRLELLGGIDAVSRIGIAVEILLDASTRIPELREISREFRGASPGAASSAARQRLEMEEITLLARLGLLREEDEKGT